MSLSMDNPLIAAHLNRIRYFNYTDRRTQVDKKALSQGLKLVSIAVDEYEAGNTSLALSVYLSGLDKLFMAIPSMSVYHRYTSFILIFFFYFLLDLSDARTKETIQEKIKSLESEIGITTTSEVFQRSDMSNRNTSTLNSIFPEIPSDERASSNLDSFKKIEKMISNTVIQGVILFKHSPIPDLVHIFCSYIMQLLLWIDKHLLISKKIELTCLTCIKWIITTDEKYRLHEYAAETIYSMTVTLVKAAIAYKEAPGYSQKMDQQDNRQDHRVLENGSSLDIWKWMFSW
ncbi:hypothetical protein BDB01DRAFT_787763 [Pilobolus umbonatus]|nr:hypothetical protein BDB01DRAFT_787763 [Pilobolus umbonatus]